MDGPPGGYLAALDDFRDARRGAALERIVARLTGKSANLLPFEEVRKLLKATGGEARGLREIPLSAIVGSVGRYSDFTRSFLPTRESDQERWARVKVASNDARKLPPIEVYQIGDAYFVLDGNHRVSVAHQLGATTILAYVTETATRVPLPADVQPDDLRLMAEYADFLERTRLDDLRPDANLRVTLSGRYPELEEHIAVHAFVLKKKRGVEVPYAEVVAHWYDTVYRPVIESIREQRILEDFPGRTETDLYLWVTRHQAELRRALGWDISSQAAVTSLAEREGTRLERVAARVGVKLREALTPPELEVGPAIGQWRRERMMTARPADRLFADILVAISGERSGWPALDQAICVAQKEEGRLLGLHIERAGSRLNNMQSQVAQTEFEQRTEASAVPGQFVLDVGHAATTIAARAWWADLVVVPLVHPPARAPLARLKSGFRTLIRSVSRPLLAVPAAASPLDRPLLAYDGSGKANEALFIATYLAARWELPLVVVTVVTPHTSPEDLARARTYLEERGVPATYLQERGDIADALLRAAAAHHTDFFIMGGYGYGTMREVVLGSTVDRILRTSKQPVLICR